MAVTFNDYIYNCYNSRYGASVQFRDRGYNCRTLEECAPFHKYLKVDLNKDIIEVPCVYKYMITNVINDINNTGEPIDTVYIPIFYIENDSVESKSSNPVLRKFFYETPDEHNLTKKKGSGTVYIGGNGIIFYEDYTPLMMLTMEIKKELTANNKIRLTSVRQLVRVNPIVYKRDDLMAKHIRTKFLTNILTMKLDEDTYNYTGYRSHIYRLKDSFSLFTDKKIWYDFKVIIEDFSDFFYTPKVPDITFSSTAANHMLEDSIEDIIKDIK